MISDKRIATKFLLFLLFCAFVSGNYAKVRCIESEREALLSFKNGLIDKNGILSSWRSNECCKWHGVECSNTTGHVITLNCDFCGLQGEVRSSLLELYHLNYLDLSGNDFGGIPIPKFIGSMKQLQTLYLRRSNFSGTIPPQLGNLINLLSLDLAVNDFGTLPPLLGNLTKLLSLDLSFNSLNSISAFSHGSVFESLEALELSYNQLESMPDLRAFPSLIHLKICKNNLTGSIPENIGQLSKLQHLVLSHNSLEGLVSETHFLKLDKLKMLDLSFNSLLTLDIAPHWNPPFQLDYIRLARCNVGPYFPKWIRTQMNLSHLDLSGTNIKDEAPRWLWSVFSSLFRLDLPDNQISGTIPNLSSSSIEYMDHSYNQFSGPIPLFPVDVFHIHLNGNMFSGSISSICQTHHDGLEYLRPSNNKLSGEVPNCWEKIPKLMLLSLANNNFSGEIPRSLGALDLYLLQMHDNNVEKTGQIFSQIVK